MTNSAADTIQVLPEAGSAQRGLGLPARVPSSWSRAVAANFRHSSLALIDQAVVSGVSFTTTVLLGRLAGPDELGLYSLGATLVVLLGVAQDAVITTPYTVYGNRLQGKAQTKYAGSALIHQIILAALSMVGLVIGVMVVGLSSELKLAPILWVLAGIVPFALFREFGRRLSVAHLRMDKALRLDASVAVMQIAGLVTLGLLGLLRATTVLIVIGGATAAASLVWLWRSRHRFHVSFDDVYPAWQRNWAFGRWVFASRMTAQLNSDVLVLWLLTFVLGRSAVGVFAACMSIVFFANPFILGAGLILTPKVAAAFARGGRAEVRRTVGIATACLASVLIVFVGVVMAKGGEVMQLLYGDRYAGYDGTLIVLAAAVAVGTLGMGASNGLLALERPEANFRAAVQGAVVMLVAAALLMKPWGLLGAAFGLLIGQTVDSATRLVAFHRATVQINDSGDMK